MAGVHVTVVLSPDSFSFRLDTSTFIKALFQYRKVTPSSSFRGICQDVIEYDIGAFHVIRLGVRELVWVRVVGHGDGSAAKILRAFPYGFVKSLGIGIHRDIVRRGFVIPDGFWVLCIFERGEFNLNLAIVEI